MDKLAELLGKKEDAINVLNYCPYVVLALKTTRLYFDNTKTECWIDMSSWFSHGKSGMYIVGTLVVNVGLDQISQSDKLQHLKAIFNDNMLHWMPSKYFIAMYDLQELSTAFQKTFSKKDIELNQYTKDTIIRDAAVARGFGHKMTTAESYAASAKKLADGK
eukprot:TRINITY_DN3958_c0_g1_i1.p1 TRINITY_DN3958_c0_g1~~TRINITY_DN3958_c0_g1_i1.p1  ORF type:complete len:162 (+),score=23.92 TRINITY_DN3958_c0_g1_i1:379-864(+)